MRWQLMKSTPKIATWLVILAVGFAACSDADGNVGLRTSDENLQAELGEAEAPQVIGGEDSDDPSENEGALGENANDGDASSSDDGGAVTVEADGSADPGSTTTTAPADTGLGGDAPATGTGGDDTETSTGAGPGTPSDTDDENEPPTQPAGPVQPPLDPSEEPDDDVADDPAAEGRVDVSYPSAPVTNLSSGAEVDLAGELAGRKKRTLLWFWQPGAGPSEAEADVVARMEDELGDSIDVIAVGTGGDLAGAKAFAAGSGLGDVTLLWDGSAEAVEYYEVGQLPSSILLDLNGDIIGRWNTLSPEVFQLVRILS